MKFFINFEGDSRFSFAIKKTAKTPIYSKFTFLLLTLIFGVPLELYLAQYSILVVLVLFFVFLFKILPIYWKIYREIHDTGFKEYYFSDTVLFVAFEKTVYSDHAGRHLIKRGFQFGEHIEKFMYCFVPALVYNSEFIRHWVGFIGQVIYPIIVILVPLFFGTTFLLAKGAKQFVKRLRKDFFVRLMINNIDEIVDWGEEIIMSYKPAREVIFYLDYVFDRIGDILYQVFEWLRMEIVLVLMQIDYFSQRYVKVLKTLQKMFGFSLKIIDKLGLHKFIKPFINGYSKIDQALSPDLIKKTTKSTINLKENIEDVKDRYELYKKKE